jgi:hypothetical protein
VAEPQVYFWVPPDTAAHRGKTLPGASRAESPRNLSLRKQGAGTHMYKAASHEDTSRTGPAHPACASRQAKLCFAATARQRREAHPPRSHDNSRFTLQSTSRSRATPHPIGFLSDAWWR